jgi:hypothetical protein
MKRLLLIGTVMSAMVASATMAASNKPRQHLIPSTNAYLRSLYGNWNNVIFGKDVTKFPIVVFFQDPLATATFQGGYTDVAAAAAAININTFLLISGHGGVDDWPESFGGDVGELADLKTNNLYVIGGYYVPYNCDSPICSIPMTTAIFPSLQFCRLRPRTALRPT